jgi:hypothetical protein
MHVNGLNCCIATEYVLRQMMSQAAVAGLLCAAGAGGGMQHEAQNFFSWHQYGVAPYSHQWTVCGTHAHHY